MRSFSEAPSIFEDTAEGQADQKKRNPKRQCGTDQEHPVKKTSVPIRSYPRIPCQLESEVRTGMLSESQLQISKRGAEHQNATMYDQSSLYYSGTAMKLSGSRLQPGSEVCRQISPMIGTDRTNRTGFSAESRPWGSCPVCGARFSSDRALERHVEAELQLMDDEPKIDAGHCHHTLESGPSPDLHPNARGSAATTQPGGANSHAARTGFRAPAEKGVGHGRGGSRRGAVFGNRQKQQSKKVAT